MNISHLCRHHLALRSSLYQALPCVGGIGDDKPTSFLCDKTARFSVTWWRKLCIHFTWWISLYWKNLPKVKVPFLKAASLREKKFSLLWKMALWEVEWTWDTTLKRTFCSSLNFSMGSTEVKLISLNTINVGISNYKVTNWHDQPHLIKV